MHGGTPALRLKIPLLGRKKPAAVSSRFLRKGIGNFKKTSRREVRAHDVGDHTNPLFFAKNGFPARHFSKTVGDTVVDKIRLVARGFEFWRFARVGTVAMAMATLTVPDLFARFNVSGILHHSSGERRNRFVGRSSGIL